MSPSRERASWWAIGFVAGAALGWILASLGGLFLGLAVLLPFGAGRGRAGAAIGGALTGAGLAALAVHGLAGDLPTLAAAVTLLIGAILSWAALRP